MLTAASEVSNGITPFQPDWVIPLHAGKAGHAIFVFPASHSDPALSQEAVIARAAGGASPVWGLAFSAALRDLARQAGAAAVGAEYVAQIRAIQPHGPYLLFGNCLGGYLAWETARQLLATGETTVRLLFHEVPLRRDFTRVRTGPLPINAPNVFRLGHYYAPSALPIHLTHQMTPSWASAGWWRPWQQVALLGMETVLLPEGSDLPHAERMGEAIRDWSSTVDPA